MTSEAAADAPPAKMPEPSPGTLNMPAWYLRPDGSIAVEVRPHVFVALEVAEANGLIRELDARRIRKEAAKG